MTGAPLLRVARPTDDLERLLRFYRDGLGLQVLHRFDDHDGFHGVMLGHPRAPWHLEFTRLDGHASGRAPTKDDLLVLFLPDAAEWRAATKRMADEGFEPVMSFNPYWDQRGLTYEDPDGYRVVLHNDDWSL